MILTIKVILFIIKIDDFLSLITKYIQHQINLI